MIIKGLVNQMCDEDFLKKEKIGASWYYWDFPADKLVALNRQMETTTAKRKEQDEHEEASKVKRAQLVAERSDPAGTRAKDLGELRKLQSNINSLNAKLTTQSMCDPLYYAALSDWERTSREGANRATDNVYVVLDYVKQKHGGSKDDPMFKEYKDLEYVNA